MRNGYFWDPATSDYFIPRGIAYQTWNPPVGANQSLAQLEYDLVEFKKLRATSVRVELVWNQVEAQQGVFSWSKPDFLVAKAEELGLKLFVLVGFQYAPDWFPDNWRATNDAGALSVVLNYEHPEVRRVYSNYIYQVASRYKTSAAIGAWILGNEYAYFDLWNPDYRYLGYDGLSVARYRQFLSARYGGNIAALNAAWGASYPNFEAVPMFQAYPPDRNNPGYQDLILWRQQSIGNYVAVGAVAARLADPNHLRTYSMIGGLFVGNDANYTCEDAKTIVACCRAAGAPLDFWSINNYATTFLGAEMRSADFGIAKHQAQSGLPVLVTETGHSTTEDFPLADVRQGKALVSQMWEALVSGAIGTHIFTWNDRDVFNGVFAREKGFGIVQQNRLLKEPAFDEVQAMFARMENLKVERLFPNSSNPPVDLQFFWSQSALMGWPRANHENAMLWGALKRLGYQPGIIDDEQFAQGAYTNAAALVLSRCYQMDPAHLDQVATNAIPAGIHLLADADLPGQFNAYHHPNPAWLSRMSYLFDLNVAGAWPGWDSGATNAVYHQVFFTGQQSFGPLTAGVTDSALTWKVWHGLTANPGGTIVTHTGDQGTQAPLPALQLKNLGPAKTAITTFALGDLNSQAYLPPTHQWDFHNNWLHAICRDHFGLPPSVALSGPGASYVTPDYRICRDGSVLIGLLNEHTNSASVTLTASSLLAGRTVENLTSGGLLETNSDGVLSLAMAGDDYVLLYAYAASNGVDHSLLNPNPNKIWIESAPAAVWPNGSNWTLTVGYDTRDTGLNLFASFEPAGNPNKVYAQTAGGAAAGRGSAVLPLLVPDADLNDSSYASSHDGGRYVFHAWLEKAGARVSETFLSTRLSLGVRPLSLPATVAPGSNYQITVAWQELPSWLPAEAPLPLSRAALWEPFKASLQYYKVVLQLLSGGQVVASQESLLNTGTGQQTLSMAAPTNAAGPFTWQAYLQSVPGASVDMMDSFEDRDTGAEPALFTPWQCDRYAQLNNATLFAAGVDSDASDGSQGLFMVVNNPPDPGSFSGFFIDYVYPQPWSLPHDARQWTNYTFACDFKEALSQPCVLELQVKDMRGGQIHFTKTYVPGSNRWDRVQASLDQFLVPPWIGFFDSTKVSAIYVNVQMLRTNTTYHGSFDNVRFVGLKTATATVAPFEVWEGFDDRTAGDDPSLLLPWVSYCYSAAGNVNWLGQGINSAAPNGGQTAFLTVTNPPNPGAYSGFGMYYLFTNQWALPTNGPAWSNYVFSLDFKEPSAHRCVLELQIKSSPTDWLEFTKAYLPNPNGWDTIRAPLSQFVQSASGGSFDRTRVQALAVNIQMLDTRALYLGLFDNIYFDTPDQAVSTGATYAVYRSDNDSFRIRSITLNTNKQITITWPNGILQFAPKVTGPWNDVPGATNPYSFTPAGGQLFFRLRQ
jgi:hypothetical protein